MATPNIGELHKHAIQTHKLQEPNCIETKYIKGQEVYVVGMGSGKIQFIGDEYQGYPIMVAYDDFPDAHPDKFEDFTHDGKVHINDLYPSLLLSKPEMHLP